MGPLSKITLDGILAALFVAALGSHVTGGEFHEWICLIWSVLVIIHCWWNRRWFTTLFKSKYTPGRAANVLVILILATGLVTMVVSGVMNSSHVFKFLEYEGSLGWRRVHSFAAYWSMVFTGIHAGLHWRTVSAILRRGRPAPSALARGTARILATVIALFGLWASFDRGMGAKLFAGAAFDFWDTDRPDILFFTTTFAILGMYAIGIHCIFSATGKRSAAASIACPVPGAASGTVKTTRKNEERA